MVTPTLADYVDLLFTLLLKYLIVTPYPAP